MKQLSRRKYLTGAATAAALAGCLGGSGDGGGGSSDGDSGDGGEETLTLDALAVGGSPGGTVPARPAGEPALVDFFATWCAPCKPQMKELRTVKERFPDFHLVSVTRESDIAAIESFWQEYEGTWPVATDPQLQVFQHYGVRNVPTKVIVDSEGTEQWRHSGLAAADTIAEEVEAVR